MRQLRHAHESDSYAPSAQSTCSGQAAASDTGHGPAGGTLYTQQSLRAELARIYRNPSDGFMWEAKPSAGGVTFDDIAAYCWRAYSKARSAAGVQVIGRIADIHQSIQAKIANIMQGQTLFDTGTSGNVLKMDKWCLVMNDCWLLGGIHRKAEFALMSGATWQNVWNPHIGGFVVTARELIGLDEFGYARQNGAALGPGSVATASFVCKDPSAARDANLEAYHLAVALRESRGPLGALDLVR